MALQPDRMADPPNVRRIAHPDSLGGIATERPFTIDMLAGLDRGHHRAVMIGYLDADRDEIDIGMARELVRIGKRQRDPVMPRRRLGRFLARRAHRGDLELRQRAQRRDMGNRGKTPVGAGPDDPDANFAARHHEIRALVLLSGGATDEAKNYVAGTPSLSVFGAVSKDDKVPNVVADTKEVTEKSKNPHSVFKIYPGTEHGARMFAPNPDLEPMLIGWLKAELGMKKPSS